MKFSASLIDSELLVSSYCKAENMGYLNQLHFYWDELIVKNKCPFLKIELLRDNPQGVDIKGWKDIVKKTGFDMTLIENHLSRM